MRSDLIKQIVIVSAKSASMTETASFPPDPNSRSSTIHTVRREIEDTGGEAVAIPVDVRSYESIQSLVSTVAESYGQIDVLIYNAGAIWWSAIRTTPMARFRLMQQTNPEGLYGCVQAVLPHFEKRGIGRIVTVCPPIYSRFFRGKTAYAMGKVGMSVLVKGLAMDFERGGHVKGKERGEGMAIVGIWPATVGHLRGLQICTSFY